MSFPAEIDENSDNLPDLTKIKNLPKFTQDNESDSLVLRRLGKLKGGAISERIFNLVPLWQYRLWSFQAGGTKLERFLHKNQHTQRKLLNFKFWINGELSKIGHHFSNKVI